ncbi:MAG: DUF3786 domain-containing protein [Thermodesulfobacteriota bacterium]
MPSANSPSAIMKLLERSNCRECGAPTCLAFAAAVFKGARKLAECPRLDPAVLAQYQPEAAAPLSDVNKERDEAAARLREALARSDLAALAEKAGGTMDNGRLRITVLGKEFLVDPDGTLHSQIHLHAWVAIPIMSYLLNGRGLKPQGRWATWRDLPGGREFEGLFLQRVQKPLAKVAAEYTDLLKDMLEVFKGVQVDREFDSDISLVLSPLPKVPVLVCYWAPEDGMDADLNLFFDETAADNLGGINPLYTLTAGLSAMFQKIARTHGGKN